MRVEPVPGMRDHGMHVGRSEMEVAIRDIEDGRVDLHPGDLDLFSKCRGVLAGPGAARDAPDPHTLPVRLCRFRRTAGKPDDHLDPEAPRQPAHHIPDWM